MIKRISTKKELEIMSLEEATAARRYIDSLQGGSYAGTIVGFIGTFWTMMSTVLGIAGTTISIAEGFSGSNLEEQENFYTYCVEQLGKPMFDLVEIEQPYVYIEIYQNGVKKYEGWTLDGNPKVTRVHTTGGGWQTM